MNKLKRILAGVASLACMMSMVSCFESGKEKEKEAQKEQNAQQVQEIMQKSYKAIEIEADCPIKNIIAMTPVGETGNILIDGSVGEDYTPVSYITDKEFSVFTEIQLNLPEGDNIDSSYRTIVTNDGTIFMLATITDYGDFERPDYNDPDFDYENFDYEAMEEAAVNKYFLYVVDADGNVVSETEMTALDKYMKKDEDGNQSYIGDCFPIGDDKICLSIGAMDGVTFVTLDKDGNISDDVDMGEEEYFYPYGPTADGRLAFISYGTDGLCIKFIDNTTMSVSADTIDLGNGMENYDLIAKGTGDYLIYLKSYTGLYGLKADGTTDELINWVDSDLSADYIYGIISDENGEFIIFEQNWEANTSTFYRLTKRDASEIENVQIINMVVEYNDTSLLNAVKKFNKSNSEYRIKIDNYSEYYIWDEETEKQTNTPAEQLKKDIADGKKFDIICMPDTTSLYGNLSNKGALVDMYQFLDNDADISRDDILPIALQIGEYNGELTTLSPSLSLNTLACKSKYYDKENWTMDELMATYESMPEGMRLFSSDNTKLNIFGEIFYSSNDFIDFTNATCTFDSPEFIKCLEFCNQFDNEGEGDSIDWENATDDEMQEYWEEAEVAIRNDKALIGHIYFSDLREYARAIHGEFGDDITLVGFPSKDGTGIRVSSSNTFAIMKSSANQQGCWDFIKTFFSEEYQESENLYQVPALKSSFNKKLDATMEKPFYTDENGKKHEYDDTFYMGGEEVEIPPLTQKERDYLEQYILNTKVSKYYYDDKVIEIILEEVESYFKGDKTVEATAKSIQNRVSILISEQA